jgi:outer membrane receptor protein involved in Fe transport
MRKVSVPSLLAVVLVCSAICFGQTGTGEVTGTVRDASGAVVSGAKVTVQSANTGLIRDTATNSSGIYTVPSLRPDQYNVSIEAAGFQKVTSTVQVAIGSTVDVSTQLKVGAASESVEVTASNGIGTVNTENPTMSQEISARLITELPTLTRNPYDLVAIAGNVAEDNTSGRGVGFAINGQRSSSTGTLLDGGENVNLFTTQPGQTVPLDSVQEFSVLTNNYGAEYGHAGGGIVNLVTKSGGNNYHGTLYEFNRISALSSNTYNNDALGLPKDPFVRNQFGYSLGGPIIKNKLFFFSNTEWIRVRGSTTQTFDVVDPSFLSYLAANPVSSSDGTTSSLQTVNFFNRYGALRSGLTTLQTIPFGAVGKLEDGTCLFGISCDRTFGAQVAYRAAVDSGGGDPQNTYMSVARVDYNLSDKTTLFGRYAIFHDDLFAGVINNSPYDGYDTGENDLDQNVTLNLTHVFGPTLVSTTKLVYNRLNELQPLGTAPVTPGLFLDGFGATLPGTSSSPFVMPGYSPTTTSISLPFGGPQNLYQIYEDLSWTKGKHTFKFGGNFIQTRDNRNFGAGLNGAQILGFGFDDGIYNLLTGQSAQFEVAIDPQGHLPCAVDVDGNYVITSDCLLNLPVGQPSFKRNYRYNDFALYAQDSWRVSPRLTLTLGARWEYYGVQHNADSSLDSNFYLGSGSNIFEQIRNGSVQRTRDSSVGGFWKPRYNNVAPRLGFAWDLFGDGTTSVRGGYGVSYDRNFGNVTFNTIQNPPGYAVVDIFGEGYDISTQPISTDNLGPLATTGSQCFTFGGVPPGKSCLPNSTLRATKQNIKTAYTEAWDFAIQRQLSPSNVLSLEYAGAHGVHLYDIGNINVPCFGQAYLGDQTQNPCQFFFSDRLNLRYSSINYRGDNGYSHYNGLTLKYSANNLFNLGLLINANYTWSHSTDNLSSTFSDGYWGNYGWLGYTDYFHPSYDYGNSDFDVRHRFVLSAVWDLPWMKHSSNAVARNVLGGWSIAPIFKVHSGLPFTILDCSFPSTLTICGRWSSAGAPVATSGGASRDLGGNTFNYLQLPNTGGVVDGIGDALQVPDQSIFCNTVEGGNPFTCSGAVQPQRNSFYGPGYWNADINFYKNFKLTERFNLQFRGEFYNIFNHHNLYIDTTNLDVSRFDPTRPFVQAEKGGIFGFAGGPQEERRNIQLALKLTF